MINFIDEVYLKENTPVANNVDVQRIDFLFQDSINILINRRLGRSFTYYLDSVQLTTVNPIEIYVIGLVRKCQAWYIAQNSIIVLANLNTNKGAQRQYGDYSQSSSQSDDNSMVMYCKGKLEEYLIELSDYLCENKENIPQFTDSTNADSTILKGCSCGNHNRRDNGLTFGRVSWR